MHFEKNIYNLNLYLDGCLKDCSPTNLEHLNDIQNFSKMSLESPRNEKTNKLYSQVKKLLPDSKLKIADNIVLCESLSGSIEKLISNAFIISEKIAFDFFKKHYGIENHKQKVNFIDKILTGESLSELIEKFTKGKYTYILAVGGGRTTDYAKFISFKTSSLLLVIPSSLATHVYASPKIHALKPIKELGYHLTIDGDPSHLSIIDSNLLTKLYMSNKRLIFSGFGDIMAFINSRYDWKESSDRGNEIYSYQVDKSIKYIIKVLQIIDVTKPIEFWIKDYVFIQCLLCNITHWVGSAPASGAEHLFAKCIEHEVEDTPLHGEVVALGVLIFSFIRGKDIELVSGLLKKFKISTKLSELGLNKNDVINALTNSLEEGNRKFRYTILNNLDNSEIYFRFQIDNMISKSLITE